LKYLKRRRIEKSELWRFRILDTKRSEERKVENKKTLKWQGM